MRSGRRSSTWPLHEAGIRWPRQLAVNFTDTKAKVLCWKPAFIGFSKIDTGSIASPAFILMNPADRFR